MAFRGGRGGGRRFGRGAPKRRAKEEPVQIFLEINCLEAVEYSEDEIERYKELVKLSDKLQNSLKRSPYCYEERSQRLEKGEKVDIERYSDRKSQATYVKPPLWHFIKMDTDHMPEELARGDNRVAKKVRWDSEFDLNKLDVFEKLEEKYQGKEGAERNEEGEEEEEVEENEDDGEFSDEGDYEQNEHFDDDEDDYNMGDDNDEAEY